MDMLKEAGVSTSDSEVKVRSYFVIVCSTFSALKTDKIDQVHYCWSSSAQSFLVPSPAGLMTHILLSQDFESRD
jgi:hypothetical protein